MSVNFFPGVDWGGLRREWFELLCKALFAHENGFFTRFNADDPQALVSANSFKLMIIPYVCIYPVKL